MKRSSLNPAWKAWAVRNFRGETIGWGGAKWVVITHIRNGVWKLGRLSGNWAYGDYITKQLDKHGNVVG